MPVPVSCLSQIRLMVEGIPFLQGFAVDDDSDEYCPGERG